MTNKISRIPNDVQDRNSEAWLKLCEYVDELAESGKDEFTPREVLGHELFSQIYTLPESISKLKNVKKMWLYGSALKRIPPEIGEMEALEYFDPYTSYDLNWFPYELSKCKNLKDSRISTRALYGNYKYRTPFPKLEHNPVRYTGDTVKCSVCEKEMTYEKTNQMWISLHLGTDTIPLLANLCSKKCENALPAPPENYVQGPHKGGADLVQPPDNEERWRQRMAELEKEQKQTTTSQESPSKEASKSETKMDVSGLKPLKLIRKIWEK